MMKHKRRRRKKNKAVYLLCKDKFSRLTKRQIQNIYEDYREYLYFYLKLHLTKDDFDLFVSDNYYHNVLKELKQSAKFLHSPYRLCFFLKDYKILKNIDDDARVAADNIYSFAEGWEMEILRTYFYDYTYDDAVVDAAWEDTRFDDYLDEYAKNNPEKLLNNPWDYP